MVRIKPAYLWLAAASAAVVLVLRYIVFPAKFLPHEFSDARARGAGIAQRIVELSRDTLSRLDTVAKYDQKRNYPEALIAVSNAIIANRENQLEAIRLSTQLTSMAENISRIRPNSAREIAAKAVAAEVALVTRLLYYNTYLSQLFEALKVKFANPKVAYLDGQVNDLVNKINDEVKEINKLNKEFNASMAELDRILQ